MSGIFSAAWFEIAGALFALAAAILWFASARQKPPHLETYLGRTPSDDPFVAWLRASTRLNSVAALFTGLSALCAVGHFTVSAFTH